MAKQRMIKTSFWSDPYIEELDPTGKLVFLYLLTNESCNLAGVYEIRSTRIAFETGIPRKEVDDILKTMEDDGKIARHKDRIRIVNFVKNQSSESPKVHAGIRRILKEIPEEIKNELLCLQTEESGNLIPYQNSRAIGYHTGKNIPYHTLLYFTLLYSTSLNTSVWGDAHAPTIENYKFLEISVQEEAQLRDAYGDDVAKKYMAKLENYIGSKGGDKYKSHYHTILTRIDADKVKPKSTEKQKQIEEVKEQMTEEQRKRVKDQFTEITQKFRSQTTTDPDPPATGKWK